MQINLNAPHSWIHELLLKSDELIPVHKQMEIYSLNKNIFCFSIQS